MVSASIVNGELQLPPIVLFGLAAATGLYVLARVHGSVPSTAISDQPFHGARPADLPETG